MRGSCPDRSHLHAHLDGELPRSERELLEDHLLHCAECRDALRLLRRVDVFFRRACTGRTLSPVATALPEGSAQDGSPRRGPSARIGRFRLAAAVLAIAGGLVMGALLLYGGAGAGEAREVGSRLEHPAGDLPRLAGVLARLDPDPLLSPRPLESLRRDVEEKAAGLGWAEEGGARWSRKLVGMLEDLLARGASPAAGPGGSLGALRAARALAALGRRRVLPQVRDFLVRGGLRGEDVERGLVILAGFGGRGAVRAIRRAAREAACGPEAVGRALLATGERDVVEDALRLLLRGGLALDEALEVAVATAGEGAAPLLVAAYRKGVRSSRLEDLLLQSTQALEILARGSWGDRMDVLRLRALAGDEEAVARLERILRVERPEAPAALGALRDGARRGERACVTALARCLPSVGEPDAWISTPVQEEVKRTLRDLGPAAGGALADVLRREGLPRARRQSLLTALGLAGGADAVEVLRAALDRPEDRLVAIGALSLRPLPGAEKEVARWLDRGPRRVRRQALLWLARMATPEAGEILARVPLLATERRLLLSAVMDRLGEWAVPVLLSNLGFAETRGRALAMLRSLSGSEGPSGADPAAWRRHFRLGAVKVSAAESEGSS